MKALIVDDESKARELLAFLIRQHIPEIELVQCAEGADEADLLVRRFKPHIVFLDIQMPGRNGFRWLKDLSDIDFKIVFITAYDHYAIQAIRFSAFDYLLKPVDGEDLRTMMDRLIDQQIEEQKSFEILFHNALSAQRNDFKLSIATLDGTYYLPANDILRAEADGNYTTFFLINNKKVIASKPIGLYSELLNEYGFVRCHKSHLVNCQFVHRYAEEYILLTSGDQIEVSRRRRKYVKEELDRLNS